MVMQDFWATETEPEADVWARLRVVVEARLRESQDYLDLSDLIHLVQGRLRDMMPQDQIANAVLSLHAMLCHPDRECAGQWHHPRFFISIWSSNLQDPAGRQETEGSTSLGDATSLGGLLLRNFN